MKTEVFVNTLMKSIFVKGATVKFLLMSGAFFILAEQTELSGTNSQGASKMCKGIMQDDLFNVSQTEKANEEIKENEKLKKIEIARRNMILPYFENPQNDNELLLNYQFDYIKNNDMVAWGNLITLAYKITKIYVRRFLKNNKGFFLDEYEQEEKVDIAVEYVLKRYKENPTWCVTKNYLSALNNGVTHAMLYKTKSDEVTICTDNVEKILNQKKEYTDEEKLKAEKERKLKEQKEKELQEIERRKQEEFERQNPSLFEKSELVFLGGSQCKNVNNICMTTM